MVGAEPAVPLRDRADCFDPAAGRTAAIRLALRKVCRCALNGKLQHMREEDWRKAFYRLKERAGLLPRRRLAAIRKVSGNRPVHGDMRLPGDLRAGHIPSRCWSIREGDRSRRWATRGAPLRNRDATPGLGFSMIYPLVGAVHACGHAARKFALTPFLIAGGYRARVRGAAPAATGLETGSAVGTVLRVHEFRDSIDTFGVRAVH